MDTPTRTPENFFKLNTLTLRSSGAAEADTADTDSIQNSQKNFVIKSSSQANYLLTSLVSRARTDWKLVLGTSLVALNLLLISVLYSHNDSRISENYLSIQELLDRETGAAIQQPLVLTKGSESEDEKKSLRNIFLSLASQQSELNSIRESVKDTENKLDSLEVALTSRQQIKDEIFQALVKEANISFCASDLGRLIAPVAGVFKLEFSANVHGDTYANRRMFEIKKNKVLLRDGGTVRVKPGRDNSTVDCSKEIPRIRKSCVGLEEIILILLNTGDTIEVENRFVEEGGEVFNIRMCMTITNYKEIPGKLESLVITH